MSIYSQSAGCAASLVPMCSIWSRYRGCCQPTTPASAHRQPKRGRMGRLLSATFLSSGKRQRLPVPYHLSLPTWCFISTIWLPWLGYISTGLICVPPGTRLGTRPTSCWWPVLIILFEGDALCIQEGFHNRPIWPCGHISQQITAQQPSNTARQTRRGGQRSMHSHHLPRRLSFAKWKWRKRGGQIQKRVFSWSTSGRCDHLGEEAVLKQSIPWNRQPDAWSRLTNF